MQELQLLKVLSKQHPELGSCLKKWFPKVKSVVREVSKLTGQDEPDVLQDVLLNMWEGVEYYKTPRVRYQNHLWEVRKQSDGTLVLERVDRGKPQQVVVESKEVEEPNKCSVYSHVYRNLWHFFLNKMSEHYSQQNGYYETGREKKKFVNRWDKKVKEIEVPVYEHKGEILARELDEGYTVFDYCSSPWPNPEQECQYIEFVDLTRSRLSPEANKLMDFFLSEDVEYLDRVGSKHQDMVRDSRPYAQFGRGMTFSDSTLCTYLHCNRSKLKELVQEVVESLPSEFGNFPEVRQVLLNASA